MKQPDHSSDEYDKLYMIRPLLDLVLKVFQSMYIPNQELSADESIIRYKSRLSWIQYVLKNTKLGIKEWILADAKMVMCGISNYIQINLYIPSYQ